MEFEKNLKALEEIVETMSAGRLSLSESLKAFEQGMVLAKKCQKDLNQAAQSAEKLIQAHENGEIETEPFPKD